MAALTRQPCARQVDRQSQQRVSAHHHASRRLRSGPVRQSDTDLGVDFTRGVDGGVKGKGQLESMRRASAGDAEALEKGLLLCGPLHRRSLELTMRRAEPAGFSPREPGAKRLDRSQFRGWSARGCAWRARLGRGSRSASTRLSRTSGRSRQPGRLTPFPGTQPRRRHASTALRVTRRRVSAIGHALPPLTGTATQPGWRERQAGVSFQGAYPSPVISSMWPSPLRSTAAFVGRVCNWHGL